jgi:molybdopterin/thiamine biosynthesis adenylyltransferase
MIGVATKGEGKIFITDMDQIETSNLSGHFLFRNKAIGTLKSVTSANSVNFLNHKLNVDTHCNCFREELSIIHHDVFYQN